MCTVSFNFAFQAREQHRLFNFFSQEFQRELLSLLREKPLKPRIGAHLNTYERKSAHYTSPFQTSAELHIFLRSQSRHGWPKGMYSILLY